MRWIPVWAGNIALTVLCPDRDNFASRAIIVLSDAIDATFYASESL